MDESKLTPSEQIQLGIFKAQAGNQLDGELAFMRSKAPFGNYAPKTRAEIRAEEAAREEEMAEHEAERLEDERVNGRIVVRYEQPSIFGRIWNIFYCGLWYAIWFFIPIALVASAWVRIATANGLATVDIEALHEEVLTTISPPEAGIWEPSRVWPLVIGVVSESE